MSEEDIKEAIDNGDMESLAEFVEGNEFFEKHCLYGDGEEEGYWKYTPFGYAIRLNKKELVEALYNRYEPDLAYGVKRNRRICGALFIAVSNGLTEMAKMLVKLGATCDEDEKELLGKAYRDFQDSLKQDAAKAQAQPVIEMKEIILQELQKQVADLKLQQKITEENIIKKIAELENKLAPVLPHNQSAKEVEIQDVQQFLFGESPDALEKLKTFGCCSLSDFAVLDVQTVAQIVGIGAKEASKLIFNIELATNGIFTNEAKENHLRECSICRLEVKEGLAGQGVPGEEIHSIVEKLEGLGMGEILGFSSADFLQLGINKSALISLGKAVRKMKETHSFASNK